MDTDGKCASFHATAGYATSSAPRQYLTTPSPRFASQRATGAFDGAYVAIPTTEPPAWRVWALRCEVALLGCAFYAALLVLGVALVFSDMPLIPAMGWLTVGMLTFVLVSTLVLPPFYQRAYARLCWRVVAAREVTR